MPRNKPSLAAAFKKFISGKANHREQSLFWTWLWKLDIEEKQVAQPPAETQERIWKKVAAQTLYKKQAPVVRIWKRTAVAAAAVMAVTLTGWLLVKNNPERKIAHHSVITNNGDAIRHITLPDGTAVTLNIYSSLEFAEDYNKTDRRVILKGEGYFEVHKDHIRPFIVQSNGIETQALGTAFNIEARETEKQVRVALTEGKVTIGPVAGREQQTLLLPGQILHYDRATSQSATTHFTTNVTAWTQGGLAFNGLPLSEALDRLSQRYHIKILYNKEKLAGKTVTASFNKTNWQHILTNILYAYEFKYQNKDGVIVIK